MIYAAQKLLSKLLRHFCHHRNSYCSDCDLCMFDVTVLAVDIARILDDFWYCFGGIIAWLFAAIMCTAMILFFVLLALGRL